jgi:nucleoside-diphosphate-sugar epimerase
MATCIIALGGSGVIGKALAKRAAVNGHSYLSLSLDPDLDAARNVQNRQIDLAIVSPALLRRVLSNALAGRKLAGVVDVIGIRSDLAEVVSDWASAQGAKVCVISSCLLYDHDGSGPVDESCPTQKTETSIFPYVSKKQLLEMTWRDQDCDTTLVRTHHILGHGALLGCIPFHNRDPNLIKTIRAQTALSLVQGGDIWLSFIHSEDLAEIVLKILLERGTEMDVVNAVHPDPVHAKKYYAQVAAKFGFDLPKIDEVEVASEDFWSLTAKNNVFESKWDVVREHHFLFDLAMALSDTISLDETAYANLGKFMQRRIQGET